MQQVRGDGQSHSECDELQLTQAPAALTVHPPQGCSHGLDGPCQLLQGSVQGVPITLQDGPKGLGDCLGEEGVTEGWDVSVQWLWTFAAPPCQLCPFPSPGSGDRNTLWVHLRQCR